MKTLAAMCLIFGVIWLASGCYYDNEEYLYPEVNNPCDTVNITYSKSIVPILANNCLSCHSNASAAGLGGNIKLENYADVKTHADDHKLLGSISQSSGFFAMPLGAPKLDDCKITTVRLWINAGAPNN